MATPFPLQNELKAALLQLGTTEATQTLLNTLAGEYKKSPESVSSIVSPLLAFIAEAAAQTQPSKAVKNSEPNGKFPDKTVQLKTPPLQGPGEEALDFDSATCAFESSFLSPRGKFQVAVFPKCFALRNKSATYAIKYEDVCRILILEKPKCPQGTVYILVSLSSQGSLQVGKQRVGNLLIQTKEKEKLDVANPRPGGGLSEARLQGSAAVVLSQLLALTTAKAPEAVDKAVFCANAGATSVKAIHKVSDGLIFPLRTCLAFVEKPTMCVAPAEVHSVEFTRAGGSTFDLLLHLKDGQTVEFSMISQDDAHPLSEYLKRRKYKIGAREDHGEDVEGAMDDDQSGSESDEEDSDFDPGCPEGSGGPRARRGSDAEEDGADEEEEEDEEEDEEGQGGQEGEEGPGPSGAGADDADEDDDEDDNDDDEDDEDGAGSGDESSDEESDADSGDEFVMKENCVVEEEPPHKRRRK